MHCNTIVDITSHHCTLVFCQSDLQCSFGLTSVHSITIHAGIRSHCSWQRPSGWNVLPFELLLRVLLWNDFAESYISHSRSWGDKLQTVLKKFIVSWIVMYTSWQLWLQCILPKHWDWVQLRIGDPGERCIADRACPLSSFLTTTTHLWTCIHRFFPQVHKVLQVRVLTQTTPHSSSLSRHITSSSLLPVNPCEHQVHHVWKVSCEK